MSAGKDVVHQVHALPLQLQQTTSSFSTTSNTITTSYSSSSHHEHSSESDYSAKLSQNAKNYSHSAAIEAVNSMNRELQTLYEKYLELGVRSHLLEVDLATQFSPDLVLAVQELNESCKACCIEVEEFVEYSENVEKMLETGLKDIDHDRV